jgi:hypothetical protein
MVHAQGSFSLKLGCLTPCTSRALFLALAQSGSSLQRYKNSTKCFGMFYELNVVVCNMVSEL